MAEISLNSRTSVTDQFSDDDEITLITIFPAGGGEPFRFSTDPSVLIEERDDGDIYGTISSGTQEAIDTPGGATLEYPFLFVQVGLPDMTKEDIPAGTITFDNLDRSLSDAARSTTEPATVTMETVFRSDPDTVIETYPAFSVRSAAADFDSFTLVLSYDHMLDQELASRRMNEDQFPTLFPNNN
jgi:hypothetical protein